MSWLIAGGVSWLFGHLGLFIVLTLLAFAFPKTMMTFTYLIGLPVVWGGGSIVLYLIGAICGFLPPGADGLKLAALLMSVPSLFIVHKLASDVGSVGRHG